MPKEEEICWFCKKNLGTNTYFVNLEKKEWSGHRFTVEKMVVPIPRCDACSSVKKNLMVLFWLAIGIPGGALIFIMQSPGRASLILLAVSILVSIILFILAFFRMRNNSSKTYGHHPDVQAAVKAGYAPTSVF